MIESVTCQGSRIHVHLSQLSLKATKAFTHGSVVFDTARRTVTFAALPPVALPQEMTLAPGVPVEFQLVAPDGTLRKQARSGVLQAVEKHPEMLRIAGMSTSPRRFSAEDGWGIAIYKFRAYFTHPGLKTDGELPKWLRASIARQRTLWNRLAWLCRDARRKCSPVPTEEIAEFVRCVVLPAIDAFNDALGRSKEKMRHPSKLKIEAPGLDGLWKFVGELRGRIEKGRKVPEDLLERVVDFAQRFNADYTPINDFVNGFAKIAEREAAALNLRRFEIRPIVTTFKAALGRRKTNKSAWSEGWPLIRYPDSPKAANWGLHYYFNQAGVESALLDVGPGVPGLSFGPRLNAADTGHLAMSGIAANRAMREAEISIPGENLDGRKKERWKFRFGVLEHRPLPTDSHLKEWKLLFQDGALWLCLVVELRRPLSAPGRFVAGLEIGWRRTDDGIRFGTLYEPVSSTIGELTIDLERSPRDQKDRVPFRIDMGPNRWEKRNISLLFQNQKPGYELRLAKASDSIRQIASLFPDWKPGDTVPNLLGVRAAFNNRRDYLKDTAKILLRRHLGERTPAWLEKAGRRGLLKLWEELKDDAAAQAILDGWRRDDEHIGKLVQLYAAWSTRRMEYGHAQVAHDVCRYLQAKGIGRLIVETHFLAKVAQQQDNEDPVSLKRSQKYRQFAAPGKFMAALKNTAVKYGIVVEESNPMNISRICPHCDHLNAGTEEEQYPCAGCGRQIKQDHNAAMNLARFGADPEPAEMAVAGL